MPDPFRALVRRIVPRDSAIFPGEKAFHGWVALDVAEQDSAGDAVVTPLCPHATHEYHEYQCRPIIYNLDEIDAEET